MSARDSSEIVFWVARRADRLHPARLPRCALAAARPRAAPPPGSPRRGPRRRAAAPVVSLIVAAHDEEEVIAAKVANALALDYPRERSR